MFTRCMDVVMGSICLCIGTIIGAALASFGLNLITMFLAVVSYPLVLLSLCLARSIFVKIGSSRKRLSPHVHAYVEGREILRGKRPASTNVEKPAAEKDSRTPEPVTEATAGFPKIECPIHSTQLAYRFNLTQREFEVFTYLSRGRSAKYIADELVLSENTVWAHIKRVYAKTGCHSKQEIMDLAEKTTD